MDPLTLNNYAPVTNFNEAVIQCRMKGGKINSNLTLLNNHNAADEKSGFENSGISDDGGFFFSHFSVEYCA